MSKLDNFADYVNSSIAVKKGLNSINEAVNISSKDKKEILQRFPKEFEKKYGTKCVVASGLSQPDKNYERYYFDIELPLSYPLLYGDKSVVKMLAYIEGRESKSSEYIDCFVDPDNLSFSFPSRELAIDTDELKSELLNFKKFIEAIYKAMATSRNREPLFSIQRFVA